MSGVPIQTFSDRLSCLTIRTTLLTHTSTNVLLAVLRFLHANGFGKVGVERGLPDDQRCTRNEIVLFGVAFAG